MPCPVRDSQATEDNDSITLSNEEKAATLGTANVQEGKEGMVWWPAMIWTWVLAGHQEMAIKINKK